MMTVVLEVRESIAATRASLHTIPGTYAPCCSYSLRVPKVRELEGSECGGTVGQWLVGI